MSTAAEERAIVSRLGQAQRAKLRPHRDRAHWRTWGPDRFYIERLLGEVMELQEVLLTGNGDAWSEAADIANFAAMLADRHESRATPQPGEPPPCDVCGSTSNEHNAIPHEADRARRTRP